MKNNLTLETDHANSRPPLPGVAGDVVVTDQRVVEVKQLLRIMCGGFRPAQIASK